MSFLVDRCRRQALFESVDCHQTLIEPATVYTSRLTPSPCPSWSATSFRSIPALRERLACVRRMTWKLIQSSLRSLSFGSIARRHRLSRPMDVVRFRREGVCVAVKCVRAPGTMVVNVSNDKAARRFERVVFGRSSCCGRSAVQDWSGNQNSKV